MVVKLIQPGFLYWDGFKYVTVNSPGTTGPAGGDLFGFYPDPTVVGLQGRPVASTAPSDGQILTWNAGSDSWVPQTFSVTVTGPAGGDLGGTYPNPSVLNIHGASVPAAGALTVGNVLQVSSGSSLTYAPVNLNGGNNYVTGTLPAGNQAPQNMGGDVSGVTSNATVIRIQGSAVASTVPSSAQVFIWNGSSWTPTSISTDVSLSSVGVAEVIGLLGHLLPSLTTGYLQWTGSNWAFGAGGGGGGGGFSPGGDLSGTSTAQYVQSISGSNDTGGAVPISSNSFITSASGSHSYIDLTAANSSYGYGKFLNYVEAPAFDTTVAAQLNVGTTNATYIQVGSTTANGGVNFSTKGAGFGISALLGSAGFAFNFSAGSGDYVKLGSSFTTQLTPGSLITTSGSLTVDAGSSLLLGTTTATSTQLGNSANNASTSFVTTSSGTWTWTANATQLWSLNSNRLLTHVPEIEIGTSVTNFNITYDGATVGSTPQNITLAPQAANGSSSGTTAGTSGSVIVNVGVAVSTGNEAGLQVQRNGSIVGTICAFPGNPTIGGVLCLVPGTAPTNTNYTVAAASTQVVVNAPTTSGSGVLQLGGTPIASWAPGVFEPGSNNNISLGANGNQWSTIWSEYFLTTATTALGSNGAAWEFPFAFSYGVIAFSQSSTTTTGSSLYITAQNTNGGSGSTGGSLYLMSGGTNGGSGIPGSVVVGISTNSGTWTPTGSGTSVLQVLDSYGVSFVVGNFSAVSGGNNSFGAIWLGKAISPTFQNYSFLNDNGTLYYNAPSLAHTWRIANANYLDLTTTTFYPTTAQGLSLGTSSFPWGSLYTNQYSWTSLIQTTTIDTQAVTVQTFMVVTKTTTNSSAVAYTYNIPPVTSGQSYSPFIDVKWISRVPGGTGTQNSGWVAAGFEGYFVSGIQNYAQIGSTTNIVGPLVGSSSSVSFSIASNQVSIKVNPPSGGGTLDWQLVITIHLC